MIIQIKVFIFQVQVYVSPILVSKLVLNNLIKLAEGAKVLSNICEGDVILILSVSKLISMLCTHQKELYFLLQKILLMMTILGKRFDPSRNFEVVKRGKHVIVIVI